MARPKKAAAEKRSERFNLRFTLAEIEHVRVQAQRCGLEPHAYARRRVLGHRVAPARGQVDAAVLSELNRIGVNLNQVTRALNAGAEVPTIARDTLAQLQAVLAKVAGDGA